MKENNDLKNNESEDYGSYDSEFDWILENNEIIK